jgi:hypothetical protein
VADYLGGASQASEASHPMRLALVLKRGQSFGTADWS